VPPIWNAFDGSTDTRGNTKKQENKQVEQSRYPIFLDFRKDFVGDVSPKRGEVGGETTGFPSGGKRPLHGAKQGVFWARILRGKAAIYKG